MTSSVRATGVALLVLLGAPVNAASEQALAERHGVRGATSVPAPDQAPPPAGAQEAAQAGSLETAEADAPAPREFKWNWDNTLTYGLGFRLKDRDERIIGLAAGGSAYGVNGDDGNQNYDKGIYANAVMWTTEFEFSYRDFGGFYISTLGRTWSSTRSAPTSARATSRAPGRRR